MKKKKLVTKKDLKKAIKASEKRDDIKDKKLFQKKKKRK